MCRSIKTLRTTDGPAPEPEIEEAALQFVRKISGFRKPSKANEEVFDKAVLEIADSCRQLLAALPNKKSAPVNA
ncbi:MAG: DUF2277 domain-containing protein [Actinomycetota bacterium]